MRDRPFHFKRKGLTGKQDTLALVIKKAFVVQIFRENEFHCDAF